MFVNSIRRLKSAAKVALGVYVVVGATTARAAGPTAISSCQTVSVAGNYFLTKNLTASGQDCLTLTASNINIDLKNHSITGDGTHSGITGSDLENIVVNNGKITGFHTGINLAGSTGLGDDTITNMNVSNNTGGGIFIFGCCDTFEKVTANNNGGIGIENDDCCSAVNKVVTNDNGGDGMDLHECCFLVEKSSANGNGGDGIFSDGCCSAVNDTAAGKNTDNGLDLQGCCSAAIRDVTNNNGADGVFFNGCCGDNRGNNFAVNSISNNNGSDGFEFTELRNSVANVVANSNAANGVFMTCPATVAGVKAKGNTTNLHEDTTDGACTDLNNNAP